MKTEIVGVALVVDIALGGLPDSYAGGGSYIVAMPVLCGWRCSVCRALVSRFGGRWRYWRKDG